MGLFRGFFAPFQGAAFLAREKMLHLVILPVLLNLGLAVGAAWAAAKWVRPELARGTGTAATSGLGTVFFVALTVLGALVLFVVFQPLLGAVFNDYLSERVERQVASNSGADVPRPRFFASVGRALSHGVLKLVLYGLAVVLGLLLTPAGIGPIVGVSLGALFLAYDGFDFPLSRRSAGFSAKWRYLALHPAQTIGYGLGATFLYFVPLALVVAPPLAAAGATLVYLETEQRRGQKRARGKPTKDDVKEPPPETSKPITPAEAAGPVEPAPHKENNTR